MAERTLTGAPRGRSGNGDTRDHRVELDALRGVAIIGVVGCHVAAAWTNAIGEPLPLPFARADALELLRFGSFGVSLFFLLSGYLLARTEGGRAERAPEGGYSLRSYAARRALRLVPAYYVSILVVVLLWPARVSQASVESVLWHVSFLHMLSPEYGRTLDGVYWSLTAEVVFYLLLPLLVLRLPGTTGRLVLLAFLAAVSLGTRLYVAHAGLGPPPNPYPRNAEFWFLYYLPSTHLYLFVAGMLLRALVERLGPAGPGRAALAFSLFAASVAAFAAFPYAVSEYGPTLQGPGGMAVDLLVIGFFASALLGAPLLRGALGWGPLAWIGTISYSLFLLHHTVVVLFMVHLGGHLPSLVERVGGLAPAGGWSVWGAFLVFAACIFSASVAVSYLSYRFVERPFLARKPR